MMDKILLAGFGGQGVMFIGKVLAYSGMAAGHEVCWIPSYGPEMRGGTANCSVLVADEEIHSPVISQADAGIVLNQPSYDRFLARIKPGGTLVANSSIVALTPKREDITVIAVEATELANEIGNSSLANMVCLGALLPALSLINLDSVQKAMAEVIGKKKPELYDLNVAAISKGMNR
ncbi:2-oxoacid:acceptor oxidoreductase family protein [Sporomusa termitida]|uniref:2-oxoacid:acceptor oxidoreductase, alpha subunit n=1 Tax=Sporomusa termitida TaxID=2377 RepID=A0A517DRJ6_9FIRM|nr:2-oxoacid:acceptor oxidoreductase family protein [Sporomusa termitida]QDR79980.1 2-oxoacid:acceptor oxidoreductase, alpha subunit [Sporomusa termitida]